MNPQDKLKEIAKYGADEVDDSEVLWLIDRVRQLEVALDIICKKHQGIDGTKCECWFCEALNAELGEELDKDAAK